MRGKINDWKNLMRNDVGIDLGTANILVYLKGKGLVINEPSVVAINQKTSQVVAVGREAKNMLGRTPAHIISVRPIVDGVVSDFEVTEELIGYILKKVGGFSKKLLGPRVLVGVPSGITNVEIRAVKDATYNAGASEVHIIEEPMAAAIGMHLPVFEPVGTMLIDIGGGTADIVTISLGGIVCSRNLNIAGDKFNNDIASYVRNEFKIIIGEKTAEEVKITAASLTDSFGKFETRARGRDLVSGLPKEVIVTDGDIAEALSTGIEKLVSTTKEVLENTPPEIVSDIMHRGIYLCGGGALLRGLVEILEREVGITVYTADDPLTVVVRGTGIVLDDLPKYKDVLIQNEDTRK